MKSDCLDNWTLREAIEALKEYGGHQVRRRIHHPTPGSRDHWPNRPAAVLMVERIADYARDKEGEAQWGNW